MNPRVSNRTWMEIWFRVAFSKVMWVSWYFAILYAICLYGHVANGFRWELLAAQAIALVLVALFFSGLATLLSRLKYNRKHYE